MSQLPNAEVTKAMLHGYPDHVKSESSEPTEYEANLQNQPSFSSVIEFLGCVMAIFYRIWALVLQPQQLRLLMQIRTQRSYGQAHNHTHLLVIQGFKWC